MRGRIYITVLVLLGVVGLPARPSPIGGDIVRNASKQVVSVRARRLALEFGPAGGELALLVLDSAGAVTHRVRAPGLYLAGVRQDSFAIVTREPTITLENRSIRLVLELVNDRAIAATWTSLDGRAHELELRLLSDDQTAYYGTGERFNALDQRGYILPLVTDDRYGNKGVGSHKPVPFFMSAQGFGVWVDTYVPGTLDLSGTQRLVTRIRFTDSRLRVLFLAGPRLTDLLETFTALTGRPRVPPPWAFGLWKSRDVHHNQDSVIADVQYLRRYGIPASVMVIDSPWETGYNTFEINRQQFPQPDSMFARIQEMGFELCLWLTPFVNSSNVIDMEGIQPSASNFEEAARRGFLVRDSSGGVALSGWWKGEGGLVDFTNPEAVEWWYGQLRKTKAYGARCFKADDGEGNVVPEAVFHDGTPANEMKNRYAVLYDSVMQRYVDTELDGDGVLITRSGYTGTGRYPFPWAGDNRGSFDFDDGLPSVILAGQNAALSGMPLWGSDIAGYAGRPTKEVFIRWTQFGAFTPLMQVHMTSNLGPWDFDAETLEIFRFYARLRTRLFPYLYEAAHQAARSGLPIIRPMALAFQSDPAARGKVYQYMVGPDLLVAPIYQPSTRRTVYIPDGTWIDFWSGRSLRGRQTIEVEAPLDRIPLFVRAGAILPLLPEGVETLIPRHDGMSDEIVALDDRRVLEVWPGGEASIRTWDGLTATLSVDGRRALLRIASTQPRSVQVRLLYRLVEPHGIDRAQIRRETARPETVIELGRFEGSLTLTWEEPE